MNRHTHNCSARRPTANYPMIALAGLVMAVGLTTGCLTPYPHEPDPEQVRIRNEIGNLGQSVERLQHRLDAAHEEQESLLRELEQLRRLSREQDAALTRVRTETDNRFREQEQARVADRQFMVDEVTRRISEHLSRTPAVSSAASHAAQTQRGRYHEVQPGETLSEIAKAYNVRVNVIVNANEIDNPDRLRIGQRLFIPD